MTASTSPRFDDHSIVWIPYAVEQKAQEIFEARSMGFRGVFLRVDLTHQSKTYSLVVKRNFEGRVLMTFPKTDTRLRCLIAQYTHNGLLDAHLLSQSQDYDGALEVQKAKEQFIAYEKLKCSFTIASALRVLKTPPKGCKDRGRAKYHRGVRLLRRKNQETWNYPCAALKEETIYALFIRDDKGAIKSFFYFHREGVEFHARWLEKHDFINITRDLMTKNLADCHQQCTEEMGVSPDRGMHLALFQHNYPVLGVRHKRGIRPRMYVCRTKEVAVKLVKRFLKKGMPYLNPPLSYSPKLSAICGGAKKCKFILDVTHLGSQNEPLEQFWKAGKAVLRLRVKERANGHVTSTSSQWIDLDRIESLVKGEDAAYQLIS